MNTDKFFGYFDNTHVFNVPYRCFDFDVYYPTAHEEDHVYAANVLRVSGLRFDFDVYYNKSP